MKLFATSAIALGVIGGGPSVDAQQRTLQKAPAKPIPPVSAQAAAQGQGMAILAASINAQGTLIYGAGVTSTAHPFDGGYEVFFNRDVSRCFYSATVADTINTTITAFSDENSNGSNANGVAVTLFYAGATATTNGAYRNLPFYLLVYCAN